MASNPDLVQYIADQMALPEKLPLKNKWIGRKDVSTYD